MTEKQPGNEGLRTQKKELRLTRREFLALGAATLIALAFGGWQIFINEQEKDSSNQEAEKPKVKLNFFFNAHGTAADLPGLEDKIKECDVFIPEDYGWNETTLKAYQSVASGQTPYTTIFLNYSVSSKDGRLLRALHDTKKEILLVDVPSDHELSGKLDGLTKAEKITLEKSFSETLSQIRQAGKDWANFLVARDNFISKNLKKALPVIQNMPKFKNEKEINVLVMIGASHTRLFEWAQTNAEMSSQEFAQKPFVYSFWHEAIRRYWMQKDNQYFPTKNVPESDDRLIASAAFQLLIENLYARELRNVSSMTVVMNHILRRIIGNFSFEEIKETFEKLKQQNDILNDKTSQATKDKASKMIIDQMLAKKEVQIPKNRTELEKMVWYKTLLK